MSQRLQFVCTVTAEDHVTDSRIIFGNWVEDGETDTQFELHGGYHYASSVTERGPVSQLLKDFCYTARKICDEWGIEEFQLL